MRKVVDVCDVIVFLAVQKACLQKLWLTKSKQRIDLPRTFSCVILHEIGWSVYCSGGPALGEGKGHEVPQHQTFYSILSPEEVA